MEYKGVTRTERGWASHYCCADRCLFHRSTLLEYNGKAIVVSSVGRQANNDRSYFVKIGIDRYFETMVFYANDDKYRDADVKKKLYLDYPDSNDPCDEIGANNKHEEVVDLFVDKLKKGEL